MSPSVTALSSGIKIHKKKLYQQMALILLCEEVIEPTAIQVLQRVIEFVTKYCNYTPPPGAK